MCRLTTWHIGVRRSGWAPVEFGRTKRRTTDERMGKLGDLVRFPLDQQ